MATSLTPVGSEHKLFGRKTLLDLVVEGIRQGRTLFALEGVSGVGKTELLSSVRNLLVARVQYTGLVTLNASQRPSEDLAIAAIYTQIRSLARNPESVAKRLKERFTSELPSVLVKLARAVAADLMKSVADRAEKTIGAVQEIVTGEALDSGLPSQLEELDRESRRYFIGEFLKAVEGAGNGIVIAIDNFEGADLSLITFVRHLIRERPSGVAMAIAQNTEVDDNENWDKVLADLRAKGGLVMQVDPLDRAAISGWFHSVTGRWPSTTEIDSLEERTHGRAYDLNIIMGALKYGESGSPLSDYLGYYERARRRLSDCAKQVAELLSIIKRDSLVSRTLLAAAANNLGIQNLGPPLDELTDQRLLKIEGDYVGLAHSLAQEAWEETIDEPRREQLGLAWFSAIEGLDVEELASPRSVGLIPVITALLVAQKSTTEIAKIGQRLIAVGQPLTGLELIDRKWRFRSDEGDGGAEMPHHALIAARTRLDLGRYREVDEPLTQAEILSGDETSVKIQVLLLRMKLALRRNAYPAIWALASQLEAIVSQDSRDWVECELIINTARRDLLETEGLRTSCERLLALRSNCDSEQANAIDRALARSFAKLGELDRALVHARDAVATSAKLDSIRAVGNAKLALGEVQRYRSDFDEAINAYQEAASIARGSGNRDSQIWSVLGEAACFIEAGDLERASGPLEEIAALLAEPGYDHPLEGSHATLLRVLRGEAALGTEEIKNTYASFGIRWPLRFLEVFQKTGEVIKPIPL